MALTAGGHLLPRHRLRLGKRAAGASPDLPSPRAEGGPSGPQAPAQPVCLPPGPADFLAREAQFVVTIGNIRGVLDSSVLDPDPGPQGPFISYSYYVTYDFVEDEEGEGSEYEGVLAEVRPGPS